MVSGNMAYFSRSPSLKSILILSAAGSLIFSSPSLAQSYQSYPDVVIPASGTTNPTYSAAMSLPNMTPDQIARDVVSQYDPLTGRTEYTAPDFDPFEQEAEMAGTVRLRSASSGISRDGANINGGAYMDITVLYSSASRDPYDSKGLEHAVYMNGRPVDVMTYDVQALDCQSDVTYVSYDDSYYRGASYGYLGGLYRPFPRYRGGRYGREWDLIRYGSWRGLRDRYVGYYGYDNRYDRRRRNRDRGFGDRTRDLIDRSINDVTDNRNRDSRQNRQDRRDERERAQQRELELRMRDQVSVSTRNVTRPDRLGDRRLSDPVLTDTRQRPLGSSGVSGGSTRSSSTPGTIYGSRRGQNRAQINRGDQIEQVRDLGARAGVPRTRDATPRLGNATPRLGNSAPRFSKPSRTTPSIDRSRDRTSTDRRRSDSPETRANRARSVTPSTSRRTTTRSTDNRTERPSAANRNSRARTETSRTRRAEPRAATSRPAPRPASRPATSSSTQRSNQSSSSNRSSTNWSSSTSRPPKSRSSSSNRSSKRSNSSRSSTRKVNRSFESRNKSTPRTRRYYSGGTHTDRYETTRCIKEERITLHIPADRLDAARFDGLSIALLDQHGNDIPLYIPPNYIEGFSKANPYLGAYRSGNSPSMSQPYSGPQTYGHTQQPAPYSGGYPTNPNR